MSIALFIHSLKAIAQGGTRRIRKAKEGSLRLPQHRLHLDVGQTDGRSLDGRMLS